MDLVTARDPHRVCLPMAPLWGLTCISLPRKLDHLQQTRPVVWSIVALGCHLAHGFRNLEMQKAGMRDVNLFLKFGSLHLNLNLKIHIVVPYSFLTL